jgi:hypothetical protein
MERRTSQRTINKTILREAGEERNRLILSGGQFFQRSTGGGLIFFGNVSTRRLHSRHGRLYHKTRDGHYIFDQGAHWGSQEQAEEEGPEPEAKAIKVYYYSRQLFRRTKNGVLTQAGDILHEIN